MARIPEDKIDEVRLSANIVHYISQFVNLKKAGRNFKGLCPFHTEKTPSFVVSPEKQIYHCFGCGKGGNVFSFIMEYEKLPFFEAVQKAADFAGIVLPKEEYKPEKKDYFQKLYRINEIACSHFEENLAKAKNKRWLKYFLDRGLSEETIRAFRLGYAEESNNPLTRLLEKQGEDLQEAAKLGLIQQRDNRKAYFDKFRHRVIFPFFNVQGKIVGFGGRKLREEQQPKYLNSPESPIYYKGKTLYGLHKAIPAIRNKNYVLLVEGYFDLLRLYESGIRNVVASSGTALSDDQAKLMRRYTSAVYIAFDGDEAGIKAALRSAQIVEKFDLDAFIIPLPAGEDPDSFVAENGADEFEKLIGNRMQPLEFEMDRFFANNADAPLQVQEKFINDILDGLAEMSNQIKAAMYIHQLADRFRISESLLVEQLNKVKRSKRRFRKPPPSSTADETTGEARPEAPVRPEKRIVVQSGVYKAEAGVIYLLLNGDREIRHFLLEHIEHQHFENDAFIRIYEHIMHELEEEGAIEADKVISHFQEDAEVTQILSEMMLSDETPSIKYARDCLFQLQKWQLEKRSREISQLLREEQSSPESAMHYTRELSNIRKEINKLEKEHRSHQLL
ncbi:MAG TPA: DNA primase [Caldithrix abyssi]|uniref:DNA primase n=1 Tax=Caldithrix abyssi TaxID=187145 RepID=A0A7V4U0M7_CALAY|nr:DNA primase [Caldithrix abyssi]